MREERRFGIPQHHLCILERHLQSVICNRKEQEIGTYYRVIRWNE